MIAAGFAIAMFGAGTIYDRWGFAPARRWLGILMIAAAGFYAMRLAAAGSPFPFRVFIAAIATFALYVYSRMSVRGRLPGAALIAAGILVTVMSLAFQIRRSMSFTVFWTFDHNGICHLVQMAGLLVLTAGVGASFARHET
jgi:hypothetical protein